MKLECSLILYTKINSKWLKDLNVKHDTIKRLEENLGKTFLDINHGNIFLDQAPKAKEIKAKIKKIGSYQASKLLHSKGNHKWNERTTYGLGEHICKWCNWQGLNFQKYTNSSYYSITTIETNWIKKRVEALNISPKETQMINRHMQRCSTLLIIRELQIMRHHLTLVRMAFSKNVYK